MEDQAKEHKKAIQRHVSGSGSGAKSRLGRVRNRKMTFSGMQ